MGFTDRQLIPTAITPTKPVVVTSVGHGLSDDQRVRATRFVVNPTSVATGMEQLNNRDFVVQHLTTDTFELFDIEAQPIDGTGYTTFISNGLAQFTVTGPDLDYENVI